MTQRKSQRDRLTDLEDSVAGLIALLKHFTAEMGDFSHNLSELGSQMMTRMGFIWEALGGKVEEETTPDSSEDSDAEIIPFPTEPDKDSPV